MKVSKMLPSVAASLMLQVEAQKISNPLSSVNSLKGRNNVAAFYIFLKPYLF